MAPSFGQFLMDNMRKDIIENVPDLLKHFFTDIIKPLVLQPEQVEEKNLLYSHFCQERIKTNDILFLLSIILERRNKFYNYLTVKHILKNYVDQNPSFRELDLEAVKSFLIKGVEDGKVTQDNRHFFFEFCSSIAIKETEEEEQ